MTTDTPYSPTKACELEHDLNTRADVGADKDIAERAISLLTECECELAAAQAERQWKPIETAPKDGAEIIVLDGGEVRTAQWHETMGVFTGTGGNVFDWCVNPTHWMPLPPPPAIAAQEAPDETKTKGEAK